MSGRARPPKIGKGQRTQTPPAFAQPTVDRARRRERFVSVLARMSIDDSSWSTVAPDSSQSKVPTGRT
jgi:hypothetical protein